MDTLWAALCFIAWLGVGWMIYLRASAIRLWLGSKPRGWRILAGSAGFLLALAVLAGGLFAVAQLGGVVEGKLTWWAWLAAAVLGAVFVSGQMLAAITLLGPVSRSAAGTRPDTSESQSHDS